MLPEGYAFRPLGIDDAAALAAAYERNHDHLARWESTRSGDFYTVEGQRSAIEQRLRQVEQGLFESWLLWHEPPDAVDGPHVAGSANLQNIVRGSMQGGTVGYWIDVDHLRRGLATAALEHLIERGRTLGLHRLEGGTRIENEPSQAVLRRCGFEQYGVVPQFLYLDGAWRDHVLFNLVLHDGPPDGAV